MPNAEPIVREIYIEAEPEVVFEFFVDSEKLTRWLAAEATLDPRPGGVCHQLHPGDGDPRDRKSTRLNSSHVEISYAVFCLKKKKKKTADVNRQSMSGEG